MIAHAARSGNQAEADMDKDCWGEAPFTVTPPDRQPFTIHPTGRVRWALEALIAVGPKGCTPITTPGPRWASYVEKLRRQGVPIETIHEPHGGPFPGRHARYVLRAEVRRVATVTPTAGETTGEGEAA
jgi:hypothetical protein